MRETLSRLIVALTLLVVLGLSGLFALRHNPRSTLVPAKVEGQTQQTNVVASAAHPGRLVLERENCLNCHSLGGAGNPRYPLDGVTARIPAPELVDWITGRGAATNKLSAMIIRRKQRYQQLSREDLSALIEYLRAP